MAPTKDDNFDDLREGILKDIKTKYEKKLLEEIELFSSSDRLVPASVAADVSAKFQETFSRYLTTAFDVVVGEEIASISEHDEKENSDGNANNSDQHNLSVTNEQLQEMDNCVTKVARRRKEYPKKCTKLLERSLELQAKSADKIRVNVNNVEPLEERGGLEDDSKNKEIEQELEELQSTVRKQIQKSVQIESSLRILGESVKK
jgi:hypothetical protein